MSPDPGVGSLQENNPNNPLKIKQAKQTRKALKISNSKGNPIFSSLQQSRQFCHTIGELTCFAFYRKCYR